MEDKDELKLLEQFVLSNPELDELEKMLSSFNIFETLNIVHAEVRHSNVLSWLLNPTANHGLGDFFTKQFFKHLISRNKDLLPPDISLFDFEFFNYSDIEIRREWSNIDLLIILTEQIKEEEKRYVIAIENKVSATEHSNQLERYRKIVEDEFKEYNHIYVYLTPEELSPSDDNWITFSYSDIADLLNSVLNYRKDSINETVRKFIEQYDLILRRYIVGNSEVERICQQIYKKHQKALDIIFQYKPDLDLEVSEYIQEILKNTPEIIIDTAGKTVIRFTTKTLDSLIDRVGDGWTASKRMFLFEFQNYGKKLVVKLYIGPGLQEYRQRLLDHCKKDETLFKLAQRPSFGTKWHSVYQKNFLKPSDYEEATIEDLKIKLDEKWNEFLQKDFVKINEFFKMGWEI
jgi:hypothetical protein